MVQPRFIYAFISQSIDPYNIAFPWQSSVQDGLFKMNYDLVDATKDNLKLWANTNWGDRPMKFRFGLDAMRYLFEEEETSKNKIKENALSQLPTYFPYIEIINLGVMTFSDDESLNQNTIRFRLDCKIQSDPFRTITIDEVIGR